MQRYFLVLFFAWAFFIPLFAFQIGNPAQPALLEQGVVIKKERTWSFRFAYLDDYVYSQHFINGTLINEKPPVVQLSTDAAQITLNFRKWLDFYGILGSSKLQMDQELYSKKEFSWGLGTKIVIFTWDQLRIGFDFKYFQTDQPIQFLINNGAPLNILSKDFSINYSEYQGSLGISYESSLICPYVQLSYLDSKISPIYPIFLLDHPDMEEPIDVPMLSFIGKQRWGGAVGATLLMGNKGTFAIESRFFNQNAVNASLELKF